MPGFKEHWSIPSSDILIFANDHVNNLRRVSQGGFSQISSAIHLFNFCLVYQMGISPVSIVPIVYQKRILFCILTVGRSLNLKNRISCRKENCILLVKMAMLLAYAGKTKQI